ncbi:MAG: SpoIID/LytB domain-containing protein [Candidatus Omnitrophota bacterium]
MNRTIKLIAIFIFSAFSFQLSAFSLYAQDPRIIRVAIIQDANSLGLDIKGSYEVMDVHSGEILYRGRGLKTTVTVYKSGILLGKVKSNTSKVLVRTEPQDVILVNGKVFRGTIQFIKKDNQQMLVVNNIELQDYIKGILYHEASHYWPLEALKAQAVVCRTYALYQKQQSLSKDFDVTGDVYSQVYGGKTSERFRTNKAVEETSGIVLMYKGKIFPAYFHATCAGHTEDASQLWNIDIPVLKGVVCDFCRESPHFSWHEVLSLDEIEKKLKGSAYKLDNLIGIVIVNRNKSGRVASLKLVSKKKDEVISAKDFRNIIGPNSIRSTNFNITIVDRDAVFEGIGWGHGVGLCQWGAYFMAKNGTRYEEILKYYYPESEIATNKL